MKITREDVIYVAELARIDLSDEAIDKFAGQIDEIIAYVDQLGQVPTEGVAPTSHALSLTNAFRSDAVAEPAGPRLSLANAPESEDGYFIVPKVIG